MTARNGSKTADLARCVVERTLSAGASLAGIASFALRDALSHRPPDPVPGWYAQTVWPPEARSVLVLALAHPESEPQLDWWRIARSSPGDWALRTIGARLEGCLPAEFGVHARLLRYQPGRRGIYLKDAAALAGLGAIGANNLLVTPQFGPRVRLRALTLDADLAPSGPSAYAPCAACDRPCWHACPQGAFASGAYDRDPCSRQMRADEARATTRVKYCRACELACPVGK